MCSIWLLFSFFLCFTLGSIYRRFFFSSTLFYCEEATIWLKVEEAWHKYCFFSCVSPTLFSVYLFIYHSCFFFEGEECFFTFCFFFFPFSLVARNTVAWFSRIAQPVFVLIERRCSWPLPFPISISFSSFFFFLSCDKCFDFSHFASHFFFFPCFESACAFLVSSLCPFFFFFPFWAAALTFFFFPFGTAFFFLLLKGRLPKALSKKIFFFFCWV